jgi:hypothetical protein
MSDARTPTASISHKWREIIDLPQDIDAFRDRELESLHQVWIEQKKGLDDNKRITGADSRAGMAGGALP